MGESHSTFTKYMETSILQTLGYLVGTEMNKMETKSLFSWTYCLAEKADRIKINGKYRSLETEMPAMPFFLLHHILQVMWAMRASDFSAN